MSLYINIKDMIYANLAKAAAEAQKQVSLPLKVYPIMYWKSPGKSSMGIGQPTWPWS